jgi:hypothetical protein
MPYRAFWEHLPQYQTLDLPTALLRHKRDQNRPTDNSKMIRRYFKHSRKFLSLLILAGRGIPSIFSPFPSLYMSPTDAEVLIDDKISRQQS